MLRATLVKALRSPCVRSTSSETAMASTTTIIPIAQPCCQIIATTNGVRMSSRGFWRR